MSKAVFDEMPEPNVVAWNALLTAYIRCNDVMGAERLFYLMPFRDLTTMNLMLAGYTKSGKLDLAKKLFSGMLVKDDVSWSTMIFGLSHAGNYVESFRCFRELLRLGLTPNQVSLSQVLSTCAHTGDFEFGKVLHSLIEKLGLAWIPSVNNALLDAYSKCGNLEMAYLVFERMPMKKNIVSWTSIITGLAIQGYGEEAIRMFNAMKGSGVRPDEIAFVSILDACSHAGLIEQGEKIFSMMSNYFGVDPTIEHYGCMVDLYGRSGQLRKAYDFLVQMPIPATAVIWRIILGACSLFGNVEIAERANERLAALDPANPGDCVLISNIYAHVGEQKHVVSLRQSMVEQNIRKTPGWSMI
ncbi:OLC1v1012526C1 [Oldenlandia corymbosa var. corymbosa]|uniref:OLC1v1012526C1 n=1 Tax=Oldenlandia corymbosa var. corymbosa TaxID=529605 RepID=A0AAV1DW66_OLDCO|nr:OLC1v1012526C1 [Oldenlandia corymbosa var. corymbosa]